MSEINVQQNYPSCFTLSQRYNYINLRTTRDKNRVVQTFVLHKDSKRFSHFFDFEMAISFAWRVKKKYCVCSISGMSFGYRGSVTFITSIRPPEMRNCSSYDTEPFLWYFIPELNGRNKMSNQFDNQMKGEVTFAWRM